MKKEACRNLYKIFARTHQENNLNQEPRPLGSNENRVDKCTAREYNCTNTVNTLDTPNEHVTIAIPHLMLFGYTGSNNSLE